MFIILLLIIFIFITPIYDAIMYYFNSFEKNITIKYVSHPLRYSLKKTYFKDENGIKYKWENSFLLQPFSLLYFYISNKKNLFLNNYIYKS